MARSIWLLDRADHQGERTLDDVLTLHETSDAEHRRLLMAKYRPVDLRLWNDRRFLSLSDRGQKLWLFFLTSHFSLPIPGVTVASDVSLADTLGWSVRTYRTVLKELHDKGMKIRVEGKVVWLWNAFSYPSNAPKNPNVVEGWAKSWDDVPECPLKVEIWDALRTACDRFADTFAKLFQHPTSKRSGQLEIGYYPQQRPQVFPPLLPPTNFPVSGSGSVTGSEPGAGSPRAHTRARERERACDPPTTVPTPVPAPILPVAAPPDPEAQRTQNVSALVRKNFQQQLAAYNRIRADLAIVVPPMAAVGDAAERALLELVKSWPSLDGATERIEHVLAVRVDEATRKRTLAFLGVTLWKPANFERALSMTVGEEFGQHHDPPSVYEVIDRHREAQERSRLEEQRPHLAVLPGAVA